MARQKKGSIVTKNGHHYARIQFIDESGKKRDLWRKASTKKEAKEIIKELIEESESKTAKELDATRMTFNHLAFFYDENYFINYNRFVIYIQLSLPIGNNDQYKC